MSTKLNNIFEEFNHDMVSSLEDSFEVLPASHSEVQVLNFMLYKGAYTEYGLLRRCKEELNRRCKLLEDLQLEWDSMATDKESSPVASLKKKRLESTIQEVYKEYRLIRDQYLPLYDKFKDADIEEEELKYWFEVQKRQVLRTLRFRGLYEVHELLDDLSPVFRHQMLGEIKAFLNGTSQDKDKIAQTMMLLEDKHA